ncbi:MAG: hypothetical protein GXN99_00065 [Candidatus Nanohaloarchaeota archaeon]|nr:hypothetical protein [Candidatus Nanohaloarchaeota archaeon]
MRSKMSFVIASILLISVFATGVFAYRGDPLTPSPNAQIDESVREELQQAVLEGDYETWITLREEYGLSGQGRMAQIATPDNFEKISQLHQARLENNLELVYQLKEELGITANYGKMYGKRLGRGM